MNNNFYDYMPILSASLKKIEVCTVLGTIGANISAVVGGWTSSMTTLTIMMAFDFLMGLMIAFVFKNSEKSKNGGVESLVAWKGLCRKMVTIMLVAMAYRIGLLVHMSFLKDGVCVAFCTSEAISILENAKKMGIKIPKILSDALDGLKGSDSDEE